jgi:hypothetical protein
LQLGTALSDNSELALREWLILPFLPSAFGLEAEIFTNATKIAIMSYQGKLKAGNGGFLGGFIPLYARLVPPYPGKSRSGIIVASHSSHWAELTGKAGGCRSACMPCRGPLPRGFCVAQHRHLRDHVFQCRDHE